MKIFKAIWVLPLALSAGCVSHRTPTYTVAPATTVTPVSTRETVRVYPADTTTTVVTAPPKVIATTPTVSAPVITTTTPTITGPVVAAPVVTTPGTTIVTTPTVVTEAPVGVPTTTTASAENLRLAENIRTLLGANSALNNAARDVRFSVYNGRVTMTGRTVTELERQRLNTAMVGMPGVNRVDDRIQVDLQR